MKKESTDKKNFRLLSQILNSDHLNKNFHTTNLSWLLNRSIYCRYHNQVDHSMENAIN